MKNTLLNISFAARRSTRLVTNHAGRRRATKPSLGLTVILTVALLACKGCNFSYKSPGSSIDYNADPVSPEVLKRLVPDLIDSRVDHRPDARPERIKVVRPAVSSVGGDDATAA